MSDPFAVPIAKGAELVGLSRGQFYREFLKPGRVRAVKSGKRDRIIVVSELREAFDRYVQEKRAAEAAAA